MEEEEKKEKIKSVIKSVVTFAIIILISVIIIIVGKNKYGVEKKEDIKYIKAEIVSVFISEPEGVDEDSVVQRDISFEAKHFNKNTNKEEVIFGRQIISDTYPRKVVEEGDRKSVV